MWKCFKLTLTLFTGTSKRLTCTERATLLQGFELTIGEISKWFIERYTHNIRKFDHRYRTGRTQAKAKRQGKY